jgi:hypothetical protein
MRHRRWSLAGVPSVLSKLQIGHFVTLRRGIRHPHHRAIITRSSRCLFPIDSARNQNPFIHNTMSLGTKRGYRDVNSFSNVSKGGDLPHHVSYDEHDSTTASAIMIPATQNKRFVKEYHSTTPGSLVGSPSQEEETIQHACACPL